MNTSSHLLVVALLTTAATAQAQWLPDFQIYSVQRVGLFGEAHTGSAGLQNSSLVFSDASNIMAGYSSRYSGLSTDNGRDAWAWNGNSTTQIGLVGGDHRGSEGYQYTELTHRNTTGHFTGYSERYTGVNTNNGRNAWIFNGNSTTQIGLTGGIYSGPSGFARSEPMHLNTSGQVAGVSQRVEGVNFFNGFDTWVWNGTSTVQLGLTGPAYTGSTGYQHSIPKLQNEGGQITGISLRFTGVNTAHAQDVWVWNGTSTTRIGLTGATHTSRDGNQSSYPSFQNASGMVLGFSRRYSATDSSNGNDAWAWNGVATTQLGFTGGVYTGTAGYQFSSSQFLNDAGQVAGVSYRISDIQSNNGQVAWVWNGTTTTQIGLSGPSHITNGGYQHAGLLAQNEAGFVSGYSFRFSSGGQSNGSSAWIWNGTTTIRIGLTGTAQTGSAGFQHSAPTTLNTAGHVSGYSSRLRDARTSNGRDAWVWNGTDTIQIGLSGGFNTGSGGLQYSMPLIHTDEGHLSGISYRYTGMSTQIGQDSWYFDPLTLISTPITGSVRATDNFAFSAPTFLTNGGFLLGYYTYFENGLGAGEQRAFIFRPDLGLTDLGNLITGGLTLNGWRTLSNPIFSDALTTIVGLGYVNGQSTSGQSVFIMTIPSPATTLLLSMGIVLTTIRRRA